MRQAILLEPSDLVALRAGTPLTLQVGGVELSLFMARSVSRDGEAAPPASPNGTRRTYTETQRRRLLAQYEKAERKTPWLRRHHLSYSMIFRWRQRFKAGR